MSEPTLRCDEHDTDLVRDALYRGWICPQGDARFDDEDYHRIMSAYTGASLPRAPEIRVVGCKTTTRLELCQ